MAASKPTAILFPGQGVGDASSRDLVAEVRPDLLELASELVGEDPFAKIAEGTAYAQPAVYCASIAGYERLGRPKADYFAGHSLGEVGALAAAGAIDDQDGLRIVAARGKVMEEAAQSGEKGGMLAVGSDREQAEDLANRHGIVVANENSPQQFVLSGPLSSIEAAEATAKEEGIRAKRLAVAGAFHTDAMTPAVGPFRAAMEKISLHELAAPVLSSTTVTFFTEGGIKDALAAGLTSPIRWTGVMSNLREHGVLHYLDVGPGKVLAGLVRRAIEDAEVETLKSRGATVA